MLGVGASEFPLQLFRHLYHDHDPPQFHTQLRNFYIFNPTITFLLASDWTKKADLVYPMLDQPFNLGYD